MRLALAALTLSLALPASAGPQPDASSAAAEMLDGMKLDVKLTVVERGAEPRVKLAYHPVPGATATYETAQTSTMDMTMTMPGAGPISMPLGDMPTMVMSARNTVGNKLANGMIPVRVEQLGARVEGTSDPGMKEAMAGALAGMKGMAFEILVGADGQPVQVDVTGTGDPALAQVVQQMADQMADQMAHFPPEAVGKGAKWTVELDLGLAGIDMHATQTCTLTGFSADSVDYTTELKMTMGKGGINLPGMPAEVKPEITRFEGSGSGQMHTDLTNLVSTGRMTMNMDLAMRVPAQPGAPGPTDMTMKMSQTTEMRPAK